MPIIAVINRKGGSGKSTLSTHLAVWLARQGVTVMLGDVDRQQSTRAWLKRRHPHLPVIMPWALDQKNVLKVPIGATHVVLDTPGGIHGFELAKVIMSADAVIMPVCNSLFDRESAAACHAELMSLPRIASGRCKLGVVGMRIDARTRAGQILHEWAEQLNVPFLSVLRETQLYVKSLETGQTLFDLPASVTKADLLQWEPILAWLRPIAKLMPAAADTGAAPDDQTLDVTANRAGTIPAASPTLTQALSPTARHLTGISTTQAPSLPPTDEDQLVLERQEHATVPPFLLRQN